MLVSKAMKKLSLALAVAFIACDGGTSSGGAAAADADGMKTVPNVSGIKVKVPDNAKPNGAGGAAGFHSDDDSFQFVLQEMKGAQASKTFADAKTSAEELFFKKWIKSEETSDGWSLTWEGAKVDLSGDEPKEVGIMFSFEVLRTLGTKKYKCYGSLAKKEGMDASVAACKSLKTS